MDELEQTLARIRTERTQRTDEGLNELFERVPKYLKSRILAIQQLVVSERMFVEREIGVAIRRADHAEEIANIHATHIRVMEGRIEVLRSLAARHGTNFEEIENPPLNN
jgi:hypothetical protein